MTRADIESRILREIQPGKTCILKSDGREARKVTANANQKISMRVGVRTKQTKAISYEMVRHAYETLKIKGRYDSSDFREKFDQEYTAAPCRFSMTGGILVELDLARIMPAKRGLPAYYTLRPLTRVNRSET